ncbi:MAG: BadF/BadG/BcrA/BcrD ATPase family protein [Saccharolobus sp.]
MEFLLIDAGGTSTKVYLYNDGKVKKQYRFQPASVSTVGIYRSITRITSIVSSFNKKFDGIAISLAGIDSEIVARDVKRQLYPYLSRYANKAVIEHDAHTVLLSNAEQGCIIIAGTGSIVYGFDGKRRIIKGDRGWLVGDICSGFWLGREFLREILNEFQGLTNDKSLSAFSSFKNENQLVKFLYENSCNQDKIASLSINLLKAIRHNNKKAINILQSCMDSLTDIVKNVCYTVNSRIIYYFGGMFNSPIYTSFFIKEVNKKGIKGIKSKSIISGLLKLLEL